MPNLRQNRPVDTRNEYLERFRVRLLNVLSARRRPDAEDIAQVEMMRIWTRIDEIMARYPDPSIYASVRANHAASDYASRMGTQRGEGSRVGRRCNDDGSARRRQVISGDTVAFSDEGPNVFERLWDNTGSIEELVVDREHNRHLVKDALNDLPADQRTIAMMVLGEGYEVTEAAEQLGIVRETASRKLSAAKLHFERKIASDAEFALAG